MPRTFRRQPFSVSTNSNDYPKTSSFDHVEFKGLCDSKNDVAVDASTFADLKNIYVDDNDMLVSRPPFKFYDGEAYILEEWMFGVYGLRLHRLLVRIVDGVFVRVDNPSLYSEDELYFCFLLRCMTHQTVTGTDKYEAYNWVFPVSTIGWDNLPKVTCAQIEDKIFVWFAGIDFVALNTAGLYFENAVKYLYLPICKQVINGIESDLETKSFLTDSYRRVYHHSSVSSVNFDTLIGKEMSVSLNSDFTVNKAKHLYDITVQKHQENTLIYPYASSGNNYIDIAQTDRATVVLRYNVALHSIDVSFDGKLFRPLPFLDNILGTPLLTRDGMWVIAFTTTGVARCKLVAQETTDFYEDTTFSWTIDAYARNNISGDKFASFDSIDISFVPTGYFENIDQFAYVFKAGSDTYVYTEWLSGTSEILCGLSTLAVQTDDVKVHFRYIAPTAEYPRLGVVVTLMHTMSETYIPVIQTLHFSSTEADHALRSGDEISVIRGGETTFSGYVYKLNADGKSLAVGDTRIVSNDIVLVTPFPLNASSAKVWAVNIQHTYGDVVISGGGYLFKCKRAHTSANYNAPAFDDDDLPGESTYWEPLLFDGKPAWWYEQIIYGVSSTNALPSFLQLSWADYFLGFDTNRYKIVGKASNLYARELIEIETFTGAITYSASEMEGLFSSPKVVDSVGAPLGGYDTWEDVYPNGLNVPTAVSSITYNGRILIKNLGNMTTVKAGQYIDLSTIPNAFGTQIKRTDVQTLVPTFTATQILFQVNAAYNIDTATGYKDCFTTIVYDYLRPSDCTVKKTFIDERSYDFKIQPNSDAVLTENYLWVDGETITLPKNGMLSPAITDERYIANGDNLVLTYGDNRYDKNIHKLTEDGTALASGQIRSGDLVAYASNARIDKDFLSPGYVDYNEGAPIARYGNAFYIEKLDGVDDSGEWIVGEGEIKIGDLVRLVAYPNNIILPVGNPGNPFNVPLTVEPWVYPAAPTNWNGTWPSSFPTYPPLIADVGGSITEWTGDEPLPSGPIRMYGTVGLQRQITPVSIDSYGTWYLIDGTLWVSQKSTDAALELYEQVGVKVKNGEKYISISADVPDHFATINEHYFAYNTVDGRNLLEVTTTKRDEDAFFTNDETHFLLYLPKRNEQKFSNKITNLHPLSDTDIGIFTEKEVWYVSTLSADNTIVYTKPTKSRIPVGCRDGSTVVTALDGQALMFATPRGITAMAPQDFVATTEKTLSYFSDAIQGKYDSFYNDEVMSSARIPNEFTDGYKPMIRVNTYKYWLLFYKYFDREILALDTRTGSWWVWTTPYPIKSITVGSRLHVLMQLDYTPIEVYDEHSAGVIVSPATRASLMGVSFVLADRELNALSTDEGFPIEDESAITYYDDTVDKVLNGLSTLVYENEFVGSRRVLHYASPVINWYFTSQKLHFGAINNYKTVKEIIANLKGTKTFTAKMSTKVFRDWYHPVQDNIVEVKVNEARTFIKRVNLMHTINFQYKIESYSSADEQHQLRLNSISIKYETKERIR